MIVHLPKDPNPNGDLIYLPEEKPYLALKPVADGVFLYSKEGKLVGQSLFDETGATVSIGDSRSYRVEKDVSGSVVIKPLVADDKANGYELFGNIPGGNYTLYEYLPGVVLPKVAARVTPEPLDLKFYYADLSEESNVFRTLLFTVTVNAVVKLKRVEE